jgi:hypothetical protein
MPPAVGAACDVPLDKISIRLFSVPRDDRDWIPAFAEEHHSHCTNMQNTLGYKNILGLVRSTPQNAPQKYPSYWTNILGGIEKKYSGVLNKRTRGGTTGRKPE